MKLTNEQKNYLKEEFKELCFCSSSGPFHFADQDSPNEIAEWFIDQIDQLESEKEHKLVNAVKKLNLVLENYKEIFNLK